VGLLLRAMLGLMLLRLLVPPGCCLCQASAPAARALAALAGKELPEAIPEPPEEENHHDGCPASFVSTGMGLRPATVQVMPPAFLGLAPVQADTAEPLDAMAALTHAPDPEPPPSIPLFVRYRALRW
jgi:hypothetical protein